MISVGENNLIVNIIIGNAQKENNGIKNARPPQRIGDMNFLPTVIAVNTETAWSATAKNRATAANRDPIKDPVSCASVSNRLSKDALCSVHSVILLPSL